MAESPIKITRSDDGLSVRYEFDARYISDEAVQRIRGYIDQLATENAKLQELVQDMWRELHAEQGSAQRRMEIADRMRELGVEVEP